MPPLELPAGSSNDGNPKTTDAFFYFEGLSPVGSETVLNAAREFCELVHEHCGGNTMCWLANAANPVVNLETAGLTMSVTNGMRLP